MEKITTSYHHLPFSVSFLAEFGESLLSTHVSYSDTMKKCSSLRAHTYWGAWCMLYQLRLRPRLATGHDKKRDNQPPYFRIPMHLRVWMSFWNRFPLSGWRVTNPVMKLSLGAEIMDLNGALQPLRNSSGLKRKLMYLHCPSFTLWWFHSLWCLTEGHLLLSHVLCSVYK